VLRRFLTLETAVRWGVGRCPAIRAGLALFGALGLGAARSCSALAQQLPECPHAERCARATSGSADERVALGPKPIERAAPAHEREAASPAREGLPREREAWPPERGVLPPMDHWTSPPSAAEEEARFSVGAELGLWLVTGLQPQLSTGPMLRVRLAAASIGSVALSGALGFRPMFSKGSELGLTYDLQALALALCPVPWQVRAGELSVCGQLQGGRIAASQVNVSGATSAWLEIGPSAAARIRLWPESYFAVTLGFPIRLMRAHFDYVRGSDGAQESFSTSRVGMQLELGLGLSN
jgi:hypothetical protein